MVVAEVIALRSKLAFTTTELESSMLPLPANANVPAVMVVVPV